MKEGDLVHIPQDVTLVNNFDVYKTEKPVIGIFMGDAYNRHYMVYALGRHNKVKQKHVYPMETNNGTR